MTAYPTKLIFANLEDAVRRYMAAYVDDVVRFDGSAAEAIRARIVSGFGHKGAVIFYGFDRREPTLLSAGGKEMLSQMPVDLVAVVDARTRSGYQSDIEYLDDIMDRLADRALDWDVTDLNWWDKGMASIIDGPIRSIGLHQIADRLIGRRILKTIIRRVDTT